MRKYKVIRSFFNSTDNKFYHTGETVALATDRATDLQAAYIIGNAITENIIDNVMRPTVEKAIDKRTKEYRAHKQAANFV